MAKEEAVLALPGGPSAILAACGPAYTQFCCRTFEFPLRDLSRKADLGRVTPGIREMSVNGRCMVLQRLARLLLSFLALALAIDWARRRKTSMLPQSRQQPFSFSPPEAAPPVALALDNIEGFLKWAAAAPVSDSRKIKEEIAKVAEDPQVVDALITELFKLPADDFGRHLLLLSVLGETLNPRVAEPLARFIGLRGEAITPMPPEEEGLTRGKERDATATDTAQMLQARAVEMLAFLKTPRALEETLRVAAAHSYRTVRLAAIDAYMFNHGDDVEAAERIRATVREHERLFVGLARRSRDTEPASFSARARAFYDRYPEQMPPAPQLPRGRIPTAAPTHPRASRGPL
jgi:hypothetical protein